MKSTPRPWPMLARLGVLPVGGCFRTEIAGGYGADRYGKPGPLAGAALGYSIGNFDGRARASYVQNIGRSGGMTQVYGLALSWIF